jgi:hypothetical protein
MSRNDKWSASAVAFVVAMAVLGVLVERATRRTVDAIDARFGYTPDPAGAKRFLQELGEDRYFAQAGAEAMQEAKGIDVFLYRQLDAAHRARYGKPFVVGRQLIGDCTSWGGMHAVAVADAVAWSLGEIQDPPLMPATEPLYGGARVEARGKPGDGLQAYGGWSDGATGYGVAKFLREYGVVYRQKYPTVDLTEYSGERAKQYGAYGCGGQGDAGRLDAEAKKHPLRHVTAVRSWAELTSALESGYPVTLASSQGFSSRLGPSGIAEASGQWQHQMCAIGIRHKKNGAPDDLCLILNSWGPRWQSGLENKTPADQPDGSFWARRSVVEGMLEDAWAIGSTGGFPYRDIDHGKWLAPAPPEAQRQKPSLARLIADTFHLNQ